jgi:transposase
MASVTTTAEDDVMPRKSKTPRRSKPKPVRRSAETILKIMQEVAAARAGGLTLAKALEQVGVHYNTFLAWTKKYRKPVSATPVKSAEARGQRKSPEEVRKILGDIAALRKAGKSKTQALDEIGVNPFTYKYWVRKFGRVAAAKAASTKKASASIAKESTVLIVLQEMIENRKKRQELEQAEKQIRALDARYEELRKKLGA